MIYPKGIRDLLLHAKLKYNDPVLYITENGKSYHEETLSVKRTFRTKN